MENREIDYDSVGTDEQHVTTAPTQDQQAVDEALGLQPISIRLQNSLLENLKALAQLNGIGYQPLIRQVLTRWADSEMKRILRDSLVDQQKGMEARKAA